MRIAIDAMLLGGKHSGVEVAVEGLCRGLADIAGRHGHNLLIAHRQLYDTGRIASPSLVFHRAPKWANCRPGRILFEQFVLPGIAARWGADLLHGPGYIIPLLWNRPSVVTIYDILALSHPEWCKWTNVIHYRCTVPRSARSADIVIVPSDDVARRLVDIADISAENVHVVNLGISDRMRPASQEAVHTVRRKLQLPQRYILWVGNIEPKKNIPAMVRAFEAAAGRIPHQFVLAGKTGWKAHRALKAIAASPVKHRIHRLGYVKAADIPALYTGADLLLHWSLHEGAGLTPLEAMACGTPAIVSDAGALDEIAGRRATVVPLGSVDRLAETIVEILGQRPPSTTDAGSDAKWAQAFSWNNHARKVLDLYGRIA